MNRPNVVFIISDQHRWDFVGYEDGGRTRTPNLERIARSGLIFRSAHCTSPLCCPSRAAIASGRYGMNSGCFTNLHELPPGTPTFVSQLRKHGYRTCAIGKTHMEIHAYHSDLCSEGHRRFMDSLGWDEICEVSGNGMLKTGIRCAYSEFLRECGMFDQVLNFYKQWKYFMDKDSKGYPDFHCIEWPFEEQYQESFFIAQRAIEWLRKGSWSEPFFLHIGFAAPHSPIEPFPRYMDLYRDAPEPSPIGAAEPDEDLLQARRGYRAMITQMDDYVGRIYDTLDELGILQNTIVIYTSDHGEMAGDHGRIGKTCFYEASVRVPLIIAGPGIQQGAESAALVELIDLGRTICDLCGVEPHDLDQGKSLVPVLTGQSQRHRDTLYAEMGCDRMIRDERYKLMWGEPHSDTRGLGRLHLNRPVNIPPSPPRLYDLQSDPEERRDLAGDPAWRGLYYRMLEKLLVRINENVQTQPFKDRGVYRPL